jgi:ferric-dicitrate binding protein FerR (iron transport regulator)
MIEDRFTQLLAKRLTGDISPDELREFNALLISNEGYCKEYESLKTYWQHDEEPQNNIAGIFEDIKRRTDIHECEEQEKASIHQLKKQNNWLRGVAATMAVFLLSFGAYKLLNKNASITAYTALKQLHTPSRTTAHLVLADGTQVTLNSESNIKYPITFDGKTREVYLDGEAYFDVKHDAQHPFIVHTSKFNIRVLGTAFNVKSYADDAVKEATLIRGSIRVTFPNKPNTTIMLKPTDKLVIQNNQYQLTKQTYYYQTGGDVIETAWLNNKLSFKNEPFSQLANILSRRYGTTIKFDNDNLKNFTFTGEFEKEDLNQVLLSLQIVKPFHYRTVGNSLVIY